MMRTLMKILKMEMPSKYVVLGELIYKMEN